MTRSSLIVVALVVLVFAFASLGVDARWHPHHHHSCKCVQKTEDVGPCKVDLDVCGCIHSWHFKYKATASASGSNFNYAWTKSGAGAAKHALVGLFDEMSGAGQCNCESGKVPFGKCAIDYRVCFYFVDQNALDDKRAAYKAFITAPNGAVTQVDAQATGQAAILAGLQEMARSDPSAAEKCEASMDIIEDALTEMSE